MKLKLKKLLSLLVLALTLVVNVNIPAGNPDPYAVQTCGDGDETDINILEFENDTRHE